MKAVVTVEIKVITVVIISSGRHKLRRAVMTIREMSHARITVKSHLRHN